MGKLVRRLSKAQSNPDEFVSLKSDYFVRDTLILARESVALAKLEAREFEAAFDPGTSGHRGPGDPDFMMYETLQEFDGRRVWVKIEFSPADEQLIQGAYRDIHADVRRAWQGY